VVRGAQNAVEALGAAELEVTGRRASAGRGKAHLVPQIDRPPRLVDPRFAGCTMHSARSYGLCGEARYSECGRTNDGADLGEGMEPSGDYGGGGGI
jgi:hypothetical protein